MKPAILLFVWLPFVLMWYPPLQAQSNDTVPTVQSMAAIPLCIGYYKTTHLVFPANIQAVDRGSKALLAQKLKTTNNILQVKAAKEDFTETNLTVLLSDGRLYSFNVDYAANPQRVNYQFDRATPDTAGNITEAALPTALTPTVSMVAEQVEKMEETSGVRDRYLGIELAVTGIYIAGRDMYFRIKVSNHSAIGYDMDVLRFYIKDKRKSRRTASQEIPLVPLYRYNNREHMDAHTTRVMVVAFPSFSIAPDKWMCIQMAERNGGRQLQIKMGHRTMMHPRLFRG